MTRKERTIKVLIDVQAQFQASLDEVDIDEDCKGAEEDNTEVVNALDIAIKALSAEPCEDAVSRDAFITRYKEWMRSERGKIPNDDTLAIRVIESLPSVTPTRPKAKWISVDERLPKTDNENNVNRYDVLLWVKNKNHPEREPQAYIGKLMKVKGSDGSDNFWGIETKDCEWTIWGWSYFNEPEVLAWMPLPEPYKESEDKQ